MVFLSLIIIVIECWGCFLFFSCYFCFGFYFLFLRVNVINFVVVWIVFFLYSFFFIFFGVGYFVFDFCCIFYIVLGVEGEWRGIWQVFIGDMILEVLEVLRLDVVSDGYKLCILLLIFLFGFQICVFGLQIYWFFSLGFKNEFY